MKLARQARQTQQTAPRSDRFLEDLITGLSRRPKAIPSKYFYDESGSRLFEAICELPEYYLTRTEMAIMRAHAAEMAAALGPRAFLIEYGSGSARKTRLLLDRLERPAAYVPIDISRETLRDAAATIAAAYPALRVLPICADYTQEVVVPPTAGRGARRSVYFPGSTIGNLTPKQAARLLARAAGVVGPGGGLLIGIDLRKDPRRLEAAYNDSAGLTAAFNLNLLVRANRELGADFRLARFQHRAYYDRAHGRIEMHLVSLARQRATVAGSVFAFEAGETILTEYSYKYEIDQFAALAAEAGFGLRLVWTDASRLFGVLYLETPPTTLRGLC